MIKTNTRELKDAIGKLISIVERKVNRPALLNFFIRFEINQITIIASDLEISARTSFPIECDEIVDVFINSKNLFDIVKELPDGNLEIYFNENYFNLKVRDLNYSLLTSPNTDYPKLNFEKTQKPILINPVNLIHLLNSVYYAMSVDDTRMFLNGIFLQAQSPTALRSVAIDGHRLATIHIDHISQEMDATPLIEGVLIPRKGVNELKRIAENSKDEPLTCSITANYLIIENKKDTLSIRLITRDFPKYQSVIPNKCNLKINVDKELLYSTVRRIKLLSNEQTNGIKVIVSENYLEISSSNPALGHAKEKIAAHFNASDMEINLNSKYLLDAISVLPAGEVNIQFNSAQSPIVVQSALDQNSLHIIMPLRI
jgi:DNA polymerase-3 subunit beta